MGRKLDALLGRRRFFNSSKLKPLLNLCLSRLSILIKRCHVRCLHARNDVIQLLQLGHHQRALLRVEHVLKEENQMDVYDMIESYCNLLKERINLLEKQRDCPDELEEAITGLIFASSRCRDFPELLQIRTVFTSHFGKEFVAHATELRNDYPVNPTIIQKLLMTQQNLEMRRKILEEIASQNGISLQLEDSKVAQEELMQTKSIERYKDEEEQNVEVNRSGLKNLSEEIADNEGHSSSVKTRNKYEDVTDAAQAAFESAAYAAAAARAAVELSRSESQDPDKMGKFGPELDSKVKGDDDEITSSEVKQSKG